MKKAYYNGKIISEDKVKIDFNDLGFARGYGVFDAMKTVEGHPFLLKAHFKRLQNSAKLLNIDFTLSLPEFVGIVNELLALNKNIFSNNDVTIRTTVTGGVSSNGLKMDGKPTVLITINDLSLVTPDKELYKTGAKIITIDFQRIMPEAKTTNYLTAILHQKDKEESGATEIVYHHNDLLLEGATSNIFIVKNGEFITPDKNVLSGTTRNLVIKLLSEAGEVTGKRNVKMEELFEADEVFLTGTFKGVLPIVQVDDKMIGDGQVGEKTKLAMELI